MGTDRSVREQLLEITAGCQGCHHILDPPGLAFIPFDGIGREMDTDLGFTIDASGHLPALAGDPTYGSGVDMMQKLAAAPEVHRCFAQQILHYALDPGPNQDRGTPPASLVATLDAIAADFQRANLDLKALIVRVAGSNAFRADRTFSWD
jgi:hypothetical protein